MTVGILALQGDFREHEEMLWGLGVQTQQVRLPKHLDLIERLILPGGESTTIGKLLTKYHLLDAIRERARAGMPVWGTCAGTILMAHRIRDELEHQPRLELIDIVVRRNAFGRQIASFETALEVPSLGEPRVPGVFIRAPRIESVGSDVEILARLGSDPSVVAARQGRMLVTTFHPELTSDNRFHRYFLSL